jgi:hypothetical protein
MIKVSAKYETDYLLQFAVNYNNTNIIFMNHKTEIPQKLQKASTVQKLQFTAPT